MKEWWQTVDKGDPYLYKLYSGLLGTAEQRIAQLYIICRGFNFGKK